MANVLVVCEISFIVNSAFSSTLGFFVAKKNLIGLIKFIKKKLDKKKDEGEEGTKLEDLDSKGMVLSKNEKDPIIRFSGDGNRSQRTSDGAANYHHW